MEPALSLVAIITCLYVCLAANCTTTIRADTYINGAENIVPNTIDDAI